VGSEWIPIGNPEPIRMGEKFARAGRRGRKTALADFKRRAAPSHGHFLETPLVWTLPR
jgi:hypothetical protein